MIRVPLSPGLLRWARERSGLAREELERKFRKLTEWERGETHPTLKQLEAFARAVHVPVGYLFLSEPPEEPIPIPDFRTIAGQTVARPSPNLLETIYSCQERQSWYRDFVRVNGQLEFDFVGSAAMDVNPEVVAAEMRERLTFDISAREEFTTWTDALRQFVRQADEAGVLVMVSGVVSNNSHRPLDPNEFRGFALSDPYAPLVFVNGRDTKAAQMFTLAHELAHIWLGASAVSSLGAAPHKGFRDEELWCNAVAAEFLVPLTVLKSQLQDNEPLLTALSRLARTFKGQYPGYPATSA